ncbi:MAG: integrase core domain-containing protein [Caulobacteraceae bacterium]
MDDRLCFIAACLREDEPMSGLCARFGVSRKTGHKWLERYREEGVIGLSDRSRARRAQTLAIEPSTAQTILALRQARPKWGPRKLLARLAMDHPEQHWPAASTVGDLLRREGRSKPRTAVTREPGTSCPQIDPSAPNESWSADFKGWFRTGDGVRCEPLTVTDGHSRYILACQAVPKVTAAEVQPILTRLFRAHGLPRALRTDNGSPFAHRLGLGGLSVLSVWFLKLDVWPDRIAPGRPDQNGRHERMHRTLGEDVADPPAATLSEQQARLDLWREDFNTNRPHEALGQRCPASLYEPSPRAFPEAIPAWDYPADHHTRRVDRKGYIRWRDGGLYLGEALRGETIALARRDDGDWVIRFRGFALATLSDETDVIRRSGLARWERPRPGPG